MRKNIHNPTFYLVLIIILFLSTRLYQITSNPLSLYWDEASIGYNAYSILKTGKDEWGRFLPLHFKAFGEYKLPVFIYTVTIFESILGLSELAVRLPAVLYSLGCCLLVYFLTKKISANQITALWSTLFFVTCPWFFIFSRTGVEATAGLFFYLLGIYAFLAFKNNLAVLLAAIFCLLFSMYSYNSFRLIAPLTFLILGGYLISKKVQSKRRFLMISMISITIFLIGLAPIIRFSLSGGNTRFEQVSIFKDKKEINQATVSFIANYFSHFNLRFLLLEGDSNNRSQNTGFGQLSLIQFLLIFPGLYWIYHQKSKLGVLILLLSFLAPIPTALTSQSHHALRSLSIAPFLAIIAGLGVEQLFLNSKKIQVLAAILVLGFFSYYFYAFLTDYPQKSALDWQYPYKLLNTKKALQMAQAEVVYISPKLGQPYIFTLFYQKSDPDKLKAEVEYNSPDQWGFSTVKRIGKIHFDYSGQAGYGIYHN